MLILEIQSFNLQRVAETGSFQLLLHIKQNNWGLTLHVICLHAWQIEQILLADIAHGMLGPIYPQN